MFPNSSDSIELFENKINFNKSPSLFENSSISNTKFFIINNFIENNKICNICGSSFTNKFNKERHIRDIHDKKNILKIIRIMIRFSEILIWRQDKILKNLFVLILMIREKQTIKKK